MLRSKIDSFSKILGFLFVLLGLLPAKGQHLNTIKATLDGHAKEIAVQQEFVYVNGSQDTLSVLYFNDWANAYSNKKTVRGRI